MGDDSQPTCVYVEGGRFFGDVSAPACGKPAAWCVDGAWVCQPHYVAGLGKAMGGPCKGCDAPRCTSTTCAYMRGAEAGRERERVRCMRIIRAVRLESTCWGMLEALRRIEEGEDG